MLAALPGVALGGSIPQHVFCGFLLPRCQPKPCFPVYLQSFCLILDVLHACQPSQFSDGRTSRSLEPP